MFGTDAVVQIAGEYTLFDDVGLLSFNTLIIYVDRPSVERNGSIINHIDVFVADFLVQLVREDGGILAVEVGFECMTDRFVQEDSRTSGTHDHRHFHLPLS